MSLYLTLAAAWLVSVVYVWIDKGRSPVMPDDKWGN